MRKLLPALFIALGCCAWSPVAPAHGVPQPRHGGIVDIGGEISFELVRTARQVVVYVEDHGKPVAMAGASGEILAGSESGKRLALLKPLGPNSLVGPPVPLKAGSRIFVRVTLANGSIEVGELRTP